MRLLIITVMALALSACASGPSVNGTQSPTPDPGSARNYRPLSTTQDFQARAPDSGSDAAVGAATEDAWQRIRAGLTLERHLDNAAVREKLSFYAHKQEFLDRVSERARPYLFHIVEELQKRNMPLDLALLPIVESAFQPFAYSRSRASGIWQFIPSTGVRYGLKQNWWYDGRRDIVEATRAALDYLEKLNKEFEGDWLLALAAYNAGELNVQRAVDKNRKAGRSTDFFSLQLPRETRGYVPSLLAVAELLANAERYGVRWQAIPNRPHFTIVQIDGQIELETAARLAGLSREEFRNLNPGYNQWATDPDGPHRLLVPVGTADQFAMQVAQLPPMERVKVREHVVRNGENLGLIAQKYGTSVAALQQGNNLRGTMIRAGQVLMVPGGPGNRGIPASTAGRATTGATATTGPASLHTVSRGDTLWNIGRKYGVSVANLTTWNNLAARATLQPGQKIRVSAPAVVATPERAEPEAVAVSYSQRAEQASNYVVRQGDSLWLISRRFGISVAQLLEWNQLHNSSVLRPGQTLIIARPDADAQGA